MKWLFLFVALMLLPFGISEISKQRIYNGEADVSAIAMLLLVLIFHLPLLFPHTVCAEIPTCHHGERLYEHAAHRGIHCIHLHLAGRI